MINTVFIRAIIEVKLPVEFHAREKEREIALIINQLRYVYIRTRCMSLDVFIINDYKPTICVISLALFLLLCPQMFVDRIFASVSLFAVVIASHVPR